MAEDREPDDETVAEDRPLPVGFAPAWTMAALAATIVLFSVTAAIQAEKGSDVVNLQLCFSLGLAITTYAICRFHLPTRSTSDALGIRQVPVGMIVVAMLIGCAMLLPASWIDDQIERFFPRPSEELADRTAQNLATLPRKIAFAIAAVGLGPIGEDLFFRGALHRAMRRTEAAALTVATTALSFAFFHLDLRVFPIALLGGVVLGLLRERTGSVVVSTAAHIAYNGVITIGMLTGKLKVDVKGPTHLWAAAGLLATVGLTWGLVAWADRNETTRAARARDRD